MKKTVLLLFAHPSVRRSEVNRPMFDIAQQLDGITCVDLYATYPNFKIDIDKEQRRLLAHDVIIFQFPLYWYSTPAILKEWQDLVLEYGFAYGKGGTALAGKTFFCALSAGGSEQAYQTDGYNHFKIRELLYPLEQTASLTQMTYLAPFTLYRSRSASEERRLHTHLQDWLTLLNALIDDRVDLQKATTCEHLNSDLSNLLLPESLSSSQTQQQEVIHD